MTTAQSTAPRSILNTVILPTSVTNTPTTRPTALPPCTVRTDWVRYTVVAGDTLGSIAQRTGTTVNALRQGNCLTNADLIASGQVLLVPRLPETFPLTVTPIPTVGTLTLTPAVALSDGAYRIAANDMVHVQWELGSAVSQISRVEFYVTVSQTSRRLLTTDTFLGDGAAMIWEVASTPMPTHIWTEGYNSGNALVAVSPTLRLLTEAQAAPTITLFQSSLSEIRRDEVVEGFRVPIQWEVINRPENTNLVFEQTFAFANDVIPLPLDPFYLVIPSSGTGYVVPYLPGALAVLELRVRLIDVVSDATLASRSYNIQMR